MAKPVNLQKPEGINIAKMHHIASNVVYYKHLLKFV